MEALNLNPPNLTKSGCFMEVLKFLEGPDLLKLQLVSREFHQKIVPEYFEKEDCLLVTHAGFVSTILEDLVSIRSLKNFLGAQKIK